MPEWWSTCSIIYTQHPFSGTGNPGALKHSLSVLWSRRINRE
ncbi:type II toxin-antitoxin system YoeB family toxin [Arachidicoccus rhizosphaerae]